MRNGSENQIELVMIRHGATSSNKEHRYLGRCDESLSPEGEEGLRKWRKNYPPCDSVFSSPMKRCVETARILYPKQDILTIPEWEEMDFGDFEGKNYVELRENAYYQKWIDSSGTLPFPNGESREDFIERCKQGVYKMIEMLPNMSPITIGLILHGGIIMSLISTFYGGEYFDYQVANGQGYICSLKVKEGNIQMVNVRKIEMSVQSQFCSE